MFEEGIVVGRNLIEEDNFLEEDNFFKEDNFLEVDIDLSLNLILVQDNYNYPIKVTALIEDNMVRLLVDIKLKVLEVVGIDLDLEELNFVLKVDIMTKVAAVVHIEEVAIARIEEEAIPRIEEEAIIHIV